MKRLRVLLLVTVCTRRQSWYWLLRLQWGILLQPVRESPVLRLFHRPGMRSCKRTKSTSCPMK